MTQNNDPYTSTKVFCTSSEVILMSRILSQLNILCNNLIKPYFTEMTHLLFTVHMLRPFQAFLNVLDLNHSGVNHISKRSVLYLE